MYLWSLQVRLPPQPKDDDVNEPFVPKLNDLVEASRCSEGKSSGETPEIPDIPDPLLMVQVQMPATSSKPPCMLSGAIRMARGAYFLVSLLGRGRSDDAWRTEIQPLMRVGDGRYLGL